MKIIPLTQGKVARVSDHRYDHLMQWKWTATYERGRWYAMRKTPRPFQKTIKMHREIMGVTDPKIQVDHGDGDGLNNQDYNLRVATNTQNSWNRGKAKRNTTGYKGVTFDKQTGKYKAQIKVDGQNISLGRFDTAERAARAYDAAARIYHGPFANLNFKD